MIRRAKAADIHGILSVQSKCHISAKRNASKSELEASGYLVYKASARHLASCIKGKRCIVLVARKNGKVSGYALTYPMKEWLRIKPDWMGMAILRPKARALIENRRALYFRHIASLPGEGNGEALERELFRRALKSGYSALIGEITLSPLRNRRSEEFHKSLGFKQSGSISDKRFKWGIWIKTLGNRNNGG